MPLFAVRPLVLLAISSAPAGAIGHEEFAGTENAQPRSSCTIELVNVRPVLIGNVNALQIVRHANAFRIESGIGGITRILAHIEVVRAAGEVVLETSVERGNARAS